MEFYYKNILKLYILSLGIKDLFIGVGGGYNFNYICKQIWGGRQGSTFIILQQPGLPQEIFLIAIIFKIKYIAKI